VPLDKSSITRVIATNAITRVYRLEELGAIRRLKDETDGRLVVVELTPPWCRRKSGAGACSKTTR